MNKYKLFMIVSIFILITTISGTFAWYIWSSETNALVSFDVCTPRVYFSGGATINGDNIIPVLDKEQGTKKKIDIHLNKSCDTTVFMNLYMKLDVLSSGLSDNTFVYELYKDTEQITSGNFLGRREGDIIELATNREITEESSIYNLYIYLDGKQDNPSSTQNQSFKFSLYSEGTGAIYEENIIVNSSGASNSDSTFLNTTIARKNIESIVTVDNNTVPEDILGRFDISSKGDGSVMLWYTDKDGNGLYEVKIGSSNGIIKANTNGQHMFAFLSNVTQIDLSKLDTSRTTNMYGMFVGCSKLTRLDLSNFNTSNVTNMSQMFMNCSSLANLDLFTFDTSKVNNMGSMFWGCSKLTSLNVSSFNTSRVTNMSYMFRQCDILKSLDVSNFNTSKVNNMVGMFYGLRGLTSLDLSNFDTSNVTAMNLMFRVPRIKSLDLSSFNTSKVTRVDWMFYECSSLKNIDLRNADFSNVTNFGDMFGPENARLSYSSTIYVKDEVQKQWLTSKFPSYTNIIVP